jgi:hypothetical protein
VEFGRSSVDTIFAGQFGCRRPQLVGYRALSLSVLSPRLEAGTYLLYCERLAFAAHCHSSSRYNRPKNDVTSYAGQISSSLAESSLSTEDFAIALVDELEQPKHSRQRFTVGY